MLAYIDSWEQDDALFIQTELCDLGNLARFLWEYGRAFPRLDEARVWKIFVDLSNVSKPFPRRKSFFFPVHSVMDLVRISILISLLGSPIYP